MHRIQILGLTCLAALSCAAVADDQAASPHLQATATGSTLAPALVLRSSTYRPGDRLGYLAGAPCLETRGCTSAATRRIASPRKYVDALSLGNYGPMNVKFTGDRVKVRVRF